MGGGKWWECQLGDAGARVTEDLVAAWSWDARLRGARSDVHC